MALAKMTKGRIVVHKSVADELAERLQNLGCCEFVANTSEEYSGNASVQLKAKQKHIDGLLSDTRFVLRLLEPYESEKEGGLAAVLDQAPAIELKDLAAKVDEEKFNSLVDIVRDTDRSITECRTELSRQRGLLAQLETFESLKYPLEIFTEGTETVSGSLYAVPKESVGKLSDAIAEKAGDLFELDIMSSDPKDANVMCSVICRKEDMPAVAEACSALSGNRIEIPRDFKMDSDGERRRIEEEITKLEENERILERRFESRADEGMDMARTCSDYWTILRDRLESMLSGLPTEEVLIWNFWMPEKQLENVKDAIEDFEALVQFDTVEPEEGEVPPTMLKNGWSSSVESLTLMYGTPTYGRVDPTSLMAPFFFVFLGMCFGDAGYGLLLTGIFGYMLVRHNMSGTLRNFFVMLTIGMVCTIVMGALTGSWFGDSIDVFPFLSSLVPFKDALKHLDPMNDPMTLLVISLALGFIQVIFGLFIAFKENWSSGDKFSAFADQGGWIIFLVGLLLFGLGAMGKIPDPWASLSKYVAILGALILIATQGRAKENIFGKLFSGVLSLYDVTGYLGDVLSYSRLLALGLGSAAVGMVINLLAKLVAGTPYVGIPAAILIFVLGHAFSIAVNLLGAFIHSLRLQYVEFFGKFYDANGRDFSPLRNATHFANVKEESA